MPGQKMTLIDAALSESMAKKRAGCLARITGAATILVQLRVEVI